MSHLKYFILVFFIASCCKDEKTTSNKVNPEITTAAFKAQKK
jgi:hypothetical protein